jgi:hypothetical protein
VPRRLQQCENAVNVSSGTLNIRWAALFETKKEGKMMASRSLHKMLSVVALVFVAALLQGCPLQVKLVEGCENSGGIIGEGNCWEHKKGQWPSDAQNYPNCTAWSTTNNSWVCNSLNAPCSTAAVPNGHCTLQPNSGTCDCKCL